MRTLLHPHGPSVSRRFATFSVAVCLGLAGASVALVALRSHHDEVKGTQLSSESSEQRQLRDGWRELGTLAASYPPVVPTSAPSPAEPAPGAPAPPAEPAPGAPAPPALAAPAAPAPQGSSFPSAAATPAASSEATPVATGGSLGGIGANAGNGGGGNAAPSQPSDDMQSTLRVAAPVPNFSAQSALCGPNTCNLGQVCCNWSCGTCVAPGATCDQTRCDNAIQYPASPACGLTTCNIDSVCCNPSCGICVAPGDDCSQRACG
jgi:hypothetical protein